MRVLDSMFQTSPFLQYIVQHFRESPKDTYNLWQPSAWRGWGGVGWRGGGGPGGLGVSVVDQGLKGHRLVSPHTGNWPP